MSIGSNIKKLREKHNMSQEEFGQIAGVTDKAVSTWENDTKIPRMGAIQKIADYFNIKKSEIIEDDLTNTNDSTTLSPKEEKLVLAYREHPEHQPTIDKILDICDDENVMIAARNGGEPRYIKMKKRPGAGSILDKTDYDGGRK